MKSAILKSHQKRNDESCKSRHGRGIVHVHTPTNSSNLLWLMTHWFIPQSEIWPSSSLLLFENSWNVSRKTMYFSKRLLVQEIAWFVASLQNKTNERETWMINTYFLLLWQKCDIITRCCDQPILQKKLYQFKYLCVIFFNIKADIISPFQMH